MKTYPLRVNVKPYRGHVPELRLRYLDKVCRGNAIEAYLNEKMHAAVSGEARSFDYWEIANELGMSEEDVRDILFAVDGGHNGITIKRPPEE